MDNVTTKDKPVDQAKAAVGVAAKPAEQAAQNTAQATAQAGDAAKAAADKATDAASFATEKTAETTRSVADRAAETTKLVAEKAVEATREGVQSFKANVEQATQASQQAIKETMDKSLSALNEVNAQSKRNLEAVMASMTAATRGVEALSGQAVAYTKRSVEGNVEQAKALTACRSLQEVVELQTSFAKSAMEAYVAELNRASETITAAVKDSFKPLSERATAIVETVQSAR